MRDKMQIRKAIQQLIVLLQNILLQNMNLRDSLLSCYHNHN
jgi:hypothetical protein